MPEKSAPHFQVQCLGLGDGATCVAPSKDTPLLGALKGTFSAQESHLLDPASEPHEWKVLCDKIIPKGT
jgi:hypothetical protein